jgi:uncharacterized membrane protein YfcA
LILEMAYNHCEQRTTGLAMARWKLLCIVNVAAVVGLIAATVFLIPPQTPLWIWAISSVAVLVVLNLTFWHKTKSAQPRRSDSAAVTIIILGFIFFLLDIIFHHYIR